MRHVLDLKERRILVKKAYGQTLECGGCGEKRTVDTAPEQGKQPSQLNKEKGESIQLLQNTGTQE